MCEIGSAQTPITRPSLTVSGNYMKYKGPGVDNVKHLIYPCPSKSLDSLGTHLVSLESRMSGCRKTVPIKLGASWRSDDLGGV
jgi:L-2-hydroxyglutarate oxidase LhgO